MKKKNQVSDILNEIKLMRSFFNIDSIFLVNINDESDEKRIYIRPSDDRIILDDFFYQKAANYESKVKSLIKSNWDVTKQRDFLNNELLSINELIDLKSAEDIIEYFEPILIDTNNEENNIIPIGLNNTFEETELKYITNQYSIRKKFLRQLSKSIKSTLSELEEQIKHPIKITGIPSPKIKKILSEFWYLTELEIFNDKFNEKQLSVLRYQFFSIYGMNDHNYIKSKFDILERKEDNRFSDLNKLIQAATKKIYTIDSRGVSTLKRKKRDTSKK
jgi:hypothetical protein